MNDKAKQVISDEITSHHGETWPFEVWEAWQQLFNHAERDQSVRKTDVDFLDETNRELSRQGYGRTRSIPYSYRGEGDNFVD